jgi:hypothetical protein
MQQQVKANVQASVQSGYELANLSVSQVERLTELSLAQAKLSAELAQEQLEALFSVKDPSAAMELFKEQLEVSVKSLAGFAATAFELSQEFQTETSAFAESHFDKAHSAASKAIQDNLKNAPEGSEVAVAAVKSAIESGNQAIAQARKTAKQSAAMAQEGLAKLKEHAPKATVKAPARRKARA